MPTITGKPSPLAKLKEQGVQLPAQYTGGSLWKGPEEDGITQSLLGRFLVCRERFRLLAVKGLKPAEGWSHRLGYGEMWHECEEWMIKGPDHWRAGLCGYAREQCRLYPTQQEQINHWYLVCLAQFPVYTKYWANNKDDQEKGVLTTDRVHLNEAGNKLVAETIVRMFGD